MASWSKAATSSVSPFPVIPVLCEYRPENSEVRDGQQRVVLTIPLTYSVPPPPKYDRTKGWTCEAFGVALVVSVDDEDVGSRRGNLHRGGGHGLGRGRQPCRQPRSEESSDGE